MAYNEKETYRNANGEYCIIRYPVAPNLWAAQNINTGRYEKIYTERGMCKAWIECNGDISF